MPISTNLALAVRELAHQPAGDAVEFKLGDDLLDRGVGAVVPGGAPGRQPEVFQHGEAVHHRGHLRLDADAEPHDLVTRRPAGHVLAADEDAAAGIGAADLAGQDLKNVLLPAPLGPIRQRSSRSRRDEIDVVDRVHAAERMARSLGLDDGLAHCLASCSARRRRRVLRA